MDTSAPCVLGTSPTPQAQWLCTWQTGPDAGATHHLGVGRHLLGRAHTATVRCDDPMLQPHHALMEVSSQGGIALTQLTGRAPILIEGAPLLGVAELTDDSRVEVGGSMILVHRDLHVATSAAHVVDNTLIRSPRAVPQWQPSTLHPPAPPSASQASAGGLVPALLGLAGAGALAVVTRQPMFLMFGAIGGLVALGSWATQRLAAGRRQRREMREFVLELATHRAAELLDRQRFRSFHLASVPTAATAQHTLRKLATELWARRATHPDAFLASIGLGDVGWPIGQGGAGTGADPHRATTFDRDAHDLPQAVDLGPGSRLAVSGPAARSMARSLIVQLAASCGPADLRIVIVTDHPREWDCLRAIPHLTRPDGSAAVIDESGLGGVLADLGERSAHLLLVTDRPGLLATRTSPLRRALADPLADALLVVLVDDAGVPHLCTSMLATTGGPLGRWVANTRDTMLSVPVRIAGIGERATFACTAALRCLIDPEDPLSVASGIPRELSLSTLLSTQQSTHGCTSPTAAGIVADWVAGGPDPSPRTIIGMAADGVVDIDLVRDGPHALIAGTTGAGKSELLRSLVAGMAAGASPAHLSFVLVDYKGGATFDACAALPHVVGVITDLDDRLADRALRSLQAELRRREGVLRDHDAADLATLRANAPDVLLPRLVVVIDEFAALVAEQPEFLHALVGVAQRGRSLGVHLLLATQRPSGVISDDIRANTNLRLALRLQDSADAIDVVGIATPTTLPRGVPGRVVMRLGVDDHLTFQTARCTGIAPGTTESELNVLVRAISQAALLAGAPRPPAPWQPALPPVITRADVHPGSVGVLDDPDHQRVAPVYWAPGKGHLLIVGSPAAGVTSTLLTLAVHTLAGCGAAGNGTQVYVLDGHGDERLTDLTSHPRCVAVVRLHERERLMRLLDRLRELTRTRLAGGPQSNVVLFIDGIDAVRRTLDDIDTAAEFEALEAVLANGEAAGITIVAAAEHAGAVPASVLARCAQRWVMHLHDAHDAALLGVAATALPSAATPGRFVIAGTGLVAQMVQVPEPPLFSAVDVAEKRVIPSISAIATLVDAARLPEGRAGAGTTQLPLGIDFATGDVQTLHLPDGEHLLVIGGARSGRSTTLVRLAAGWQHAHPEGWVGAILPRRSSIVSAAAIDTGTSLLDRLPREGAALVLVDDCELLDDPDGRLAALAAGARPDTWIMAAGRPDALRQLYGHWTTVVRRSRTGVVHSGGSDIDGDLLGVVLPRRTPVPARPGLAWLVADGLVRLTQVALDKDTTVHAAAALV